MYALKAYNNNPFYKKIYRELKKLSNYIYIYIYMYILQKIYFNTK